MKILFDHQTFSLQHYGGISRYFANIHHALQKQDDLESSISVLYSDNYYIADSPGILGAGLGPFLLPTQKKIYKWNKKYSKYKIGKNDFDVLHPTYYEPYFLKHLKKPFVLTVHDMIHEKFPQYFGAGDVFANYKRSCIEKASHIIAISESTKKDIQYYLNIPEERISVIHHGFQPFTIKEKTATEIDDQNYLLYVGDRNIYKNFYGFIEAITPLLKKDPDLKVVCAGGGNFQSAEVEFLLRQQVLNQVVQEDAPDERLGLLYKNARAFIFPSFYEGFGLPLLEAFNGGCPVITSNTSCFSEVCGDAAAYFDPYNTDSMRSQIEYILYNKTQANNLRIKGAERLTHFPIEKSIENTINIYSKFR